MGAHEYRNDPNWLKTIAHGKAQRVEIAPPHLHTGALRVVFWNEADGHSAVATLDDLQWCVRRVTALEAVDHARRDVAPHKAPAECWYDSENPPRREYWCDGEMVGFVSVDIANRRQDDGACWSPGQWHGDQSALRDARVDGIWFHRPIFVHRQWKGGESWKAPAKP
jgi:hypothetical protein